MALVLRECYRHFFYTLEEVADPRANRFPLMNSPLYPMVISAFYIFLVMKLLPKFMENRPAYNIDLVLKAYNTFQIFFNATIIWIGWNELFKMQDFTCIPLDCSESDGALRQQLVTYLYFLNKLCDLLDTVFFILRKNDRQVTFLHMYHHWTMIYVSWGAVKYYPGGHGLYLGFFNCLVHVVMYFYYLIASIDDVYRRNIWWKKYITQMQIVQFALIGLTFFIALVQPSCKYPKFPLVVITYQNVFITLMFTSFYRRAYMKNRLDSLEKTD